MKWRIELLVPTVNFSKSQLRNFPSSIFSSPVVFFLSHFLCSLRLSTWPNLSRPFSLKSQTCHLLSSQFLFIKNADQRIKGDRVVTRGKCRALRKTNNMKERGVFLLCFVGFRVRAIGKKWRKGSGGKQPDALTVHGVMSSSFSTPSNHPSNTPLKISSAPTHCHCSRQHTHWFHSVTAACWKIMAPRHTLSLHLKKNSNGQNTFKLFYSPGTVCYHRVHSLLFLQQFSIVWGKTPATFYSLFCLVWHCYKHINVWSANFSFHYRVKLHTTQMDTSL